MPRPALKQLENLFHEALALASEERSGFLDTACAGDAELRAAVEELLRHDGTGEPTDNFLVSPVAQAAACLRPEAATLVTAPPDRTVYTDPALPDIAGYELLEELGRGGMGVVYKARQTSLNRIVALKMLLPGGPAIPELVARFRTEAAALARLQDPHIVTIYDIGEHDGQPYFAMEYVAGPSLARLLDGRPQDIADAARFIEVLARIMHCVHQHGIIHRDLKPANILLSKECQSRDSGAQDLAPGSPPRPPTADLGTWHPRITDFGLAKDLANVRKLTQSGLAMGTPSYMAPEQARSRGHTVGPAADIYALGSILYEMLTGRPPFAAATAAETIDQLLDDEPLSPSRLRPKLPRDLVTICMKCLEKSPRKRYVSALALAEDLRRFLDRKPIRARPVGIAERAARWCIRRPLVAGLLALSGLLAVGLIVTVFLYEEHFLEQRVEEERQQIVHLNVTLGKIEMKQGDTFAALLWFTEALRQDVGPDESEREHRTLIARALRQCPELVQLRMDNRRVLCTHLAADGGWLAMVGPERQLEVCDVLTGSRAGPVLTLDEEPRTGALSPDGRLLATVAVNGTARVWEVAAGTSRQLPCRGKQAVQWAAFQADGRVLVTWHADATVRRWDLTASPLELPPSLSGGAVAYSSLSDDARWLFTLNASQVGQVWDMATGHSKGAPLRLEHAVSLVTVSRDGRWVALLGPDGGLEVWDVNGATRSPIPAAQAVTHVAFRPHREPGKEGIVTFGSGSAFQVWDVLTGARTAAASSHEKAVTQARFGPDARLMITTTRAGLARVWDVASGQALTPPLGHGDKLLAAVIRADGQHVITVSRVGTVSVWKLPSLQKIEDKEPDTRDLPPDSRPVDELVKLAQVMARSRIDEKQQRQVLSPVDLALLWEAVERSRKR
jgi:eukaryotic-like serine/threonine-protein kinase